MATRLESRVRLLEGGTGGKCPRFGFDGDWSKVEFHVEQTIGRDGGESECCDTCGRLTRIVLRWGDRV